MKVKELISILLDDFDLEDVVIVNSYRGGDYTDREPNPTYVWRGNNAGVDINVVSL